MKLMMKSGSKMIRAKAHMRILWIEYPRMNKGEEIFAVLFNRFKDERKFNIPVVTADAKGIEIKLPSFLTGMFLLKIQDGDYSFLRHIALQ